MQGLLKQYGQVSVIALGEALAMDSAVLKREVVHVLGQKLDTDGVGRLISVLRNDQQPAM